MSSESSLGITLIREFEAKMLLREHGIETPRGVLVRELPDELDLRYPVVLKVSDERILHKSDVGGVALGIGGREDLSGKFSEMRERFPDSLFIIEEMLPGGVEFIVGVVRDPVFGHMIMLGSGGIYTELYGDVAFRKIPVEISDVEDMLGEIRSSAFCSGFRGKKVNCGKLVDLVMAVCSMVSSGELRIDSMDLNPVIVTESGATVADARITVSRKP